MSIPIVENLRHLGILGNILFLLICLLIVYLALSNRVNIILPLIILSAAFVGSSISILDNLSSAIRWVAIFLLFLTGVMLSKMRVSLGGLLFWVYVWFGFVSLIRADSILWQFQRSILLILVAVTIPIAYGDKSLAVYKSTLMNIAIVAALFSLVNFLLLPYQLSDLSRYAGFSRGAPSFTMTLGGLLPFTLYGFFQAKSQSIKLICGLGCVAAVINLAFSGQRAGTIAGLTGLVPLLLMFRQTKNFIWSMLLVSLLIIVGQAFLLNTSPARIQFLISRYSINSGLSNRDLIWKKAIDEIDNSLFLGKGTGAAESIISSSFHNTYLEVWYNAGLFGLTFFIFTQIYYLLRVFSIYRNAHTAELKSILALALGYFTGFFVLCFVESVGAGASNANLILYIYLGVLVSDIHLFKQSVTWSDLLTASKT